MKDIVIFYPSFEKGGATLVLINLIKYLSKRRMIYLITNKKDKQLSKISNLKILLITPKIKFKYINNRIITGFYSMVVLFNLFKIIPKENTLVLSMQSNFFPVILSLILRLKVFVRVSEDPCGATKYADNKLFAYLVLFTKFVTYNFAYKVITNAKKSQECVKKFVLKKKKVKLLYNPTIIKIYKNKNKNIIKKNYLLCVGRLTNQKNQELLINAFSDFHKEHKNYKLLLCGDGPNKDKLLKLVSKLNLKKNIKFLGWKNSMSMIYLKAKLFVLTSYYEGMPNALIDAINFETPSIATNVSGVEDLLLSGSGGEIIKNYNYKLLSMKIKNVVKNYDQIMSKSYRAKSKLNRYFIENAGKKYHKFLL